MPKHALLPLLRIFIASSAVKLCTYDVKKFVKLIKRQIEFDKFFEERSI